MTVKFRLHRGSLNASMKTMVEIASVHDLRDAIGSPHGTIEFKPYGGRDDRIGWDETWIVSLDGHPIGFSSGPISGEDLDV